MGHKKKIQMYRLEVTKGKAILAHIVNPELKNKEIRKIPETGICVPIKMLACVCMETLLYNVTT